MLKKTNELQVGEILKQYQTIKGNFWEIILVEPQELGNGIILTLKNKKGLVIKQNHLRNTCHIVKAVA